MIPWINKAKDDDVVVSTRIRLARNLKDEFFPSIMDEQTGERVYSKVKDMLNTVGDFKFVKMKDVSPTDKHAMVEKHIISRELEQSPMGGLAKLGDESIVIMVNEEDHLRMQAITAGFELDRAFEAMMTVHEQVKDNFAFDKQFGYLTACPTNAGTGMRASAMLHLPAIIMTGQLANISNAVSKMGMTVRGIYGEGSDAVGNMVQLSNQITLGLNEREIADNLKAVASKIIDNERSARNMIYDAKKMQIEDQVLRSLGLLKYAKKLSSKETISMLSDVKMGVALKVIAGIEYNDLHRLMMETAPCLLQQQLGRDLAESDRDIERAKIIKEALKDANEA